MSGKKERGEEKSAEGHERYTKEVKVVYKLDILTSIYIIKGINNIHS